MLVELVVLAIVLLALVLPIVVLARRLGRGEPTTGGTSWGRQLFGRRRDDDWGPKPTPTAAPEGRRTEQL
ncbi:MAG: hypothetical protein ACJ77E_06890 [Gaiellaceae bacterium]